MKRPLFQKLLASTVLIGAVLGGASIAQARPEVSVSIGLPGLPVLVPPPLPFARANPVYVQPGTVYRAPPAVVYERAWQPQYRYESEREREWRHREWQRREWERRHRHWEHSQHRDSRGWD